MKKKRPVLQDVADLVGVTKMTVSRFLRNPEQVSEALRGKIAVALDELGYIPNRAPDISPMPPAAPLACCCPR
jgi:LacI family gluconate utilization system Gnt-I transcriptional repressor